MSTILHQPAAARRLRDLCVWISAPAADVRGIATALEWAGLISYLSRADFGDDAKESERAAAVLSADVITYRVGGPELVDGLLAKATAVPVMRVRRLISAARRWRTSSRPRPSRVTTSGSWSTSARVIFTVKGPEEVQTADHGLKTAIRADVVVLGAVSKDYTNVLILNAAPVNQLKRLAGRTTVATVETYGRNKGSGKAPRLAEPSIEAIAAAEKYLSTAEDGASASKSR